MPRKRRPFIRESAVRDARLIIIATEDTEATVSYFKALQFHYQSSKVQVEILIRIENASSPERILAQLCQWRDNYQIAENDELWLVIDVDRWGDKKLSRIAQECVQKSFHLAISNPAIELWFLLHLDDVHEYDPAKKKLLLGNAKINANRTYLEQAILEKIGRYNKSKLNTSDFVPYVQKAVARAKYLDIRTEDRWPQQLGTHVYRLVQSTIDSAT